MTLKDIKTYLITHQRATLMDLANHFKTEPETLQPMLAHWERKNKVRHISMQTCSKGCCANKAMMDIYEWVDVPQLQVIPVQALSVDYKKE